MRAKLVLAVRCYMHTDQTSIVQCSCNSGNVNGGMPVVICTISGGKDRRPQASYNIDHCQCCSCNPQQMDTRHRHQCLHQTKCSTSNTDQSVVLSCHRFVAARIVHPGLGPHHQSQATNIRGSSTFLTLLCLCASDPDCQRYVVRQ